MLSGPKDRVITPESVAEAMRAYAEGTTGSTMNAMPARSAGMAELTKLRKELKQMLAPWQPPLVLPFRQLRSNARWPRTTDGRDPTISYQRRRLGSRAHATCVSTDAAIVKAAMSAIEKASPAMYSSVST